MQPLVVNGWTTARRTRKKDWSEHVLPVERRNCPVMKVIGIDHCIMIAMPMHHTGRPCKRCSSRNLFCTDEKPKKKYSTDDSTLTTVISSKVAKKAGGSLDDDLVTQRSDDLRTTPMQPRMMEDTFVSPLQPHNRPSFAQLVSEVNDHHLFQSFDTCRPFKMQPLMSR